MKPLRLDPEAEAEAEDAASWYEDVRPQLEQDFRDEIESALDRISRFPSVYSPDQDIYRKCVVKRFPYKIYFVEYPEYVWIAAIAHAKRDEGYWLERKLPEPILPTRPV